MPKSQANPCCVSAAAFSAIGVVDYPLLVTQHPEAARARADIQAAMAQAKTDFDAKAAGMNDGEKATAFQQIQKDFQLKQQESLKGISENIDAAIKAVAVAKGLTVVVHKGAVAYGGQDITSEVLREIIAK
jgi:outer membrane protein